MELFHIAVICYPIPTDTSSDKPHRAQHGEGEVVVDWEAVVAVDRVGEQRRRHDGRDCPHDRCDHGRYAIQLAASISSRRGVDS